MTWRLMGQAVTKPLICGALQSVTRGMLPSAEIGSEWARASAVEGCERRNSASFRSIGWHGRHFHYPPRKAMKLSFRVRELPTFAFRPIQTAQFYKENRRLVPSIRLKSGLPSEFRLEGAPAGGAVESLRGWAPRNRRPHHSQILFQPDRIPGRERPHGKA